MTNGRERKGGSKKKNTYFIKSISSNKNKIEKLLRVSCFDSTIFMRFRSGFSLVSAVGIYTSSAVCITSSIRHRGPVTSGQLDVHLIYYYYIYIHLCTYTAHYVVNIIILTGSRRQGRRRQRLGVRYPRAGAKWNYYFHRRGKKIGRK